MNLELTSVVIYNLREFLLSLLTGKASAVCSRTETVLPCWGRSEIALNLNHSEVIVCCAG